MNLLTKQEIHEELFKLLQEIDLVCKQENIPYFLCGGSALGAVRHKGFIPWDDDIDLIVPRPYYEKLLRALQGKQDRAIFDRIFDRNYPYPFAKYCNMLLPVDEYFLEKGNEIGLYVDIFPIDGIGSDRKEADRILKHIAWCRRFIGYARLKKKDIRARKSYQTIPKRLVCAIFRTIGANVFLNRIIKLATKYPYESSTIAGNIVWGVGKESVAKEVFDESIEAEFEGQMFPIPKDYDRYLTALYGDYMTLPPEEKRIAHPMYVYRKEEKE